jgi:hypothetical protein
MLADHPRFKQLAAAVKKTRCNYNHGTFVGCRVTLGGHVLSTASICEACRDRVHLPQISFAESLELNDIDHPCCLGTYMISLCCLGLHPNTWTNNRYNVVPICGSCRELCAANGQILRCIYEGLRRLLPRELAGVIVSVVARMPMYTSK